MFITHTPCFFIIKKEAYMNFRYRFQQFMQGRYGADSMLLGLAVVYIILSFLNVFLKSKIISLLGLAIFFYCVFRFLSRNTQKRYAENLKFQRLTNGLRSFFSKLVSRVQQNKTYCFKRCPNCGKTLRLPRKRGKHTTKCPICNCSFKVHVWMGDK